MRSHIIPEHLYGSLYSHREGRKNLNKVFGSTDDASKNRVTWLQKGHRERLLCYECEQLLNENGEKYASEHFVADSARQDMGNEFLYSGLDYHKMKLYFISILWRVHWSKDAMFAGVNLPRKVEAKLRKSILKKDGGEEDYFPCFIAEDISPHLKNFFWGPRLLWEKGIGNRLIPVVELLLNGQRWLVAAHWNARFPRTGWFNSAVRKDGSLRVPKFDLRRTEFGQQIYRVVTAWPESFEQRLR